MVLQNATDGGAGMAIGTASDDLLWEDTTWLGIVPTVLLGYIVLQVVWSHFTEQLLFFRLGNFMFWLKDTLTPNVFFKCFGPEETLQLDSPTPSTVQKRTEGLEYLKKALVVSEEDSNKSKLADCRFDKTKTLMPLLKQFEHPNANTVSALQGIKAVLPSGREQYYLGNNAIHYFPKELYQKMHKEIAKKLDGNAMVFNTTSLTPELLRHSERMTTLTNMDRIRYATSGSEAVDAAIKDVRRTTNKNMIVRFSKVHSFTVLDLLACDCTSGPLRPLCTVHVHARAPTRRIQLLWRCEGLFLLRTLCMDHAHANPPTYCCNAARLSISCSTWHKMRPVSCPAMPHASLSPVVRGICAPFLVLQCCTPLYLL